MQEKNSGAYLFVCFQNDENGKDIEKLFYGISLDGYNFKALNDNNPVFTSYLGTKHMRDPFIFKGEDGYFYLVATDMDHCCGWESQSTIVIYKTADLINFDDGIVVDYSEFKGFEDCNRAWAPQIIWSPCHENADGSKGAYMVYLTLQKKSTANTIGTVLYKNFATDLMDKNTYTIPEYLISGEEKGEYQSVSAIDGDIIYDTVNKRWLMYFDGRRISQSVTGNVEGPYREIQGSPFEVDKIEGSNIYKIYDKEKWIICADGRAFGTGFRFAQTTDFVTYKQLINGIDYSLDFMPRHGYVIHITHEQFNVLMKKYGGNLNLSL